MDEPKSSVPPNLPIAADSPQPVASSMSLPLSPKSPTSPTPVALAQPLIPKPLTPPIPSSSVVSSPQTTNNQVTLPRSSIRTMESDIKSAQTGQAPKSIEIKASVLPTEVVKPAAPPPSPLKPATPPAPPTGIKLGEAEKRTSPLPGQSISKPEPKIPEKPAPPAGNIVVPPKSSIFANKKILALTAVAVLALIGGILYFGSRQPKEILVSSPTASPSGSSVPSLKPGSPVSTTLTGIFPQFFPLAVSLGDTEALENFKSEAVSISNKSLADKNTLVFVKEGTGDFYKFSSFLDRFSISFPANLVSFVDNDDFGVILTKQTEFFDSSGKMTASPSAEMLLKPKIALTVRAIDATEAQTRLISWEDTMIDSLREFYSLPPQFGDISFSENFYRGVKIRYANLPYADKSIDYTIITAKNGNDYLVIANSREQMYSIINKLLGF